MIIDGKAIAAQVKASLQGSDAKLAVIMVGDNPLPRFMSATRNALALRSVFGLALAGCRLRRRPKRSSRLSRALRVGGRYSRSASSPGTH